MAETKEKKPPQPQGEPKAKKQKARPAGETDAAPKAQEGTPRLRAYYDQTVRPRLAKEFGLTNAHQVPRLVKVVLNVGMGDAGKNPKQLEAAVEELGQITGQKAQVTKAKKAIANFGLRAGIPVGASVTLRGARMYEFLDRFITLAIPRAPEQELRRPRELHLRHQGADDLPRDRFRQGREDPRDGYHGGHLHRA